MATTVDLPAVVINVNRSRGDTHPFKIQLKVGGKPYPVTGFTFLLTVDTAEAPLNADNNLFSNAGVLTDAVAGKLEFAISTANADQTPATYYYDVPP